MNETVEIDQFQLLEEKLDSLIGMITELKKEKALLSEKVQTQEQKLSDMMGQIEELNSTRDAAKQRITVILEKIKQVDI